MLGWPDDPSEEVRGTVNGALEELRDYLAERSPEVLIAFINDHFDNLFRNLMPILAYDRRFLIPGPPRAYLDMLKLDQVREIPSNPELAEELLRGLVERDFAVAPMGRIEYGNNLMVPLHSILSMLDIPIVRSSSTFSRHPSLGSHGYTPWGRRCGDDSRSGLSGSASSRREGCRTGLQSGPRTATPRILPLSEGSDHAGSVRCPLSYAGCRTQAFRWPSAISSKQQARAGGHDLQWAA